MKRRIQNGSSALRSATLAVMAAIGLLLMPGCAAQIDRTTTVTWLKGSEHLTVEQKERIFDLIEDVEDQLMEELCNLD
jgi:hypothetical protein